jgi:hypothetical protein
MTASGRTNKIIPDSFPLSYKHERNARGTHALRRYNPTQLTGLVPVQCEVLLLLHVGRCSILNRTSGSGSVREVTFHEVIMRTNR